MKQSSAVKELLEKERTQARVQDAILVHCEISFDKNGVLIEAILETK
jgi:hypothetical protein